MLLTSIEIKDSILMALSSLRSNKLRSFLTILGVTIGVIAVIALASIIGGLDKAMEEEIDNLGSNIIMVTKFPWDTDWDELTEEQRNRPPITEGEARAILANCPSVHGVSPQNYSPTSDVIKYKSRKANRGRILGTWPDYIRVNNSFVRIGRFLNDTDEQFRRQVCVLGYEVAEALFPAEDPLDAEIRVNAQKFTVVGVLEKRESNFDNDYENRYVLVPLSVFRKMFPEEEELFLVVRAKSYAGVEQAQEEIIAALRNYRKVPFNKDNNFALATQDNLKEFVGNITKYIYLAMIIITSVGLMEGGICVMNIMLVSVTERTREIGVRKAIGAKRSNILLQFLTEAMTLSGSGGIVGIVLGVGIGILGNVVIGFPVSVSIFWVVTGFIVAVSVGLISGMYPAVKAARLDPIEALRYE
ncbi:MAG: ABC transporter permease [Candidatus Zixiibacteriota bacterium]